MKAIAPLLPLLLLVAACSKQPATEQPEAPESAPSPINPLAALTPGWNSIAPGGDTICSDGSPYQFFVRPGDPQKVLVYFQGGGGCWNGATCDPLGDPTYKIAVEDGEIDRYHGIFAFDQADNPFASHSVVFAPYCTGDVHIGDALATYQSVETEEAASREFQVHHRGYANGEAALNWMFEHFSTPDAIFVTGSSAGAIPSPYYTMKIAEQYPDARIAQLGDAAGGYRSEPRADNPANAWNTLSRLEGMPAFADTSAEAFRYETLYIGAAKTYPDILFAEYDTAEDDVQRRFLALSNNDGEEDISLLPLLKANQADIRAAVPNFRSFIAGGELHTILARPEFYTYKVGDVTVRDWVSDLSEFKAVNDVACEQCAVAETTVANDTAGNIAAQ